MLAAILASNGSTASANSSQVVGGFTRLSQSFNVSRRQLAADVSMEALKELVMSSSPKQSPMFSHSLASGTSILKALDKSQAEVSLLAAI